MLSSETLVYLHIQNVYCHKKCHVYRVELVVERNLLCIGIE